MLADIVSRMTQGLDDEAFIAGPQGHLDRARKRRAHDHGSPDIPTSAVGPLFEDAFRLVTARDVPATLFFLPLPMPPASELMEVFSFFQAEPPVAIELLAARIGGCSSFAMRYYGATATSGLTDSPHLTGGGS